MCKSVTEIKISFAGETREQNTNTRVHIHKLTWSTHLSQWACGYVQQQTSGKATEEGFLDDGQMGNSC